MKAFAKQMQTSLIYTLGFIVPFGINEFALNFMSLMWDLGIFH
jgi:hypothetical protein